MLFRNSFVDSRTHPDTARFRRYRHGTLSASGQCLHQRQIQRIGPQGCTGKRNLFFRQCRGQLFHFRIIGHRRAHQSHFGRLFRTLPDILQQQIQIAVTGSAETVARHAEPAMPPAAPGHFHNKHVGKFRIRGNDSRSMGIGIQIFYPLSADYLRYCFHPFHDNHRTGLIIVRRIKLRNIHAGQLCRCQQLFPARFLFHTKLFQKPQQFRQRLLPFADDHKIRKICQRFRIKSSAGTADDDKGILFSPFF